MKNICKSEGWGVLINLSELKTILAKISGSDGTWVAELTDDQAAVNVLHRAAHNADRLTTSGVIFPALLDLFPWLTDEPLVALHPSLAKTIFKPGVHQADPMGDFDFIWSPIREALTIEALHGAAAILRRLSNARRLVHVS